MQRIEIYTSKKKMVLLLIISTLFVAGGIWVFINADTSSYWRFRSPILKRILAIIGVLFFGTGIILSIKRLIKAKIALVIDEIGINVNPSKSSTEIIKWENILGFEELKITSEPIFIIMIKNPEHWIERETNTVRKKLMRFNFNKYNSPFSISSAALDISSTELKGKLNRSLEIYKNEVQQRI